ncbi:MAG: DNA repair protein RecO [Candidatus Pacebacteria bacterium]|nr:DNA repair protein RecO [Candidatus Paceibacterota bacterium]MBP9851566.1 DNA repair protein RecO [Candidatus Paceibacterota bacterium]
MHHIYHTQAIILGSRHVGETGKGFYLFTPDFGLVYARAQGIRKLASRLRYVLSDYAYVKVDLVRGRDVWRITSASKTNSLENIANNPKLLPTMVNLSRLLYRLLRGEEPNEALFSDLLQGLYVLEKKEDREEIANLEIVLVLRLLGNLGYIGEHAALDKLVKSPFEENLIYEMVNHKKGAVREINRALRETHL